jgi:hypothetical protein
LKNSDIAKKEIELFISAYFWFECLHTLEKFAIYVQEALDPDNACDKVKSFLENGYNCSDVKSLLLSYAKSYSNYYYLYPNTDMNSTAEYMLGIFNTLHLLMLSSSGNILDEIKEMISIRFRQIVEIGLYQFTSGIKRNLKQFHGKMLCTMYSRVFPEFLINIKNKDCEHEFLMMSALQYYTDLFEFKDVRFAVIKIFDFNVMLTKLDLSHTDSERKEKLFSKFSYKFRELEWWLAFHHICRRNILCRDLLYINGRN